MIVDLTPVIQAAVGVAAIAVGTVGAWALQRLGQRFGIEISQGKQQAFEVALEKSVQAGGVAAEQLAARKGWDHPEVRDGILSMGLSYIAAKFPDAIRGAGLDPSVPGDADKLRDALARALPTAIAPVVTSPVTTNGPDAPKLPA